MGGYDLLYHLLVIWGWLGLHHLLFGGHWPTKIEHLRDKCHFTTPLNNAREDAKRYWERERFVLWLAVSVVEECTQGPIYRRLCFLAHRREPCSGKGNKERLSPRDTHDWEETRKSLYTRQWNLKWSMKRGRLHLCLGRCFPSTFGNQIKEFTPRTTVWYVQYYRSLKNPPISSGYTFFSLVLLWTRNGKNHEVHSWCVVWLVSTTPLVSARVKTNLDPHYNVFSHSQVNKRVCPHVIIKKILNILQSRTLFL